MQFLALSAGSYSLLPSFSFAAGSTPYLLQPFAVATSNKTGIFAIQMKTGEHRLLETKFNVHNIHFDEDQQEFIGINQEGLQFIKFKDVQFKGVSYHSLDLTDYSLSGHVAAITKDPSYYLTGFHKRTNESFLLILDKKSSKHKLGPSLGNFGPPAHDCKFENNSSRLVATIGNKIHYYDCKKETLSTQIFELAQADSSLRHFSVSLDNALCVQSNIIKDSYGDLTHSHAEVLSVRDGVAAHSVLEKVDPRIKNFELLDFSFDSKGETFACTHSRSPYVSIWQTKPFKNAKVLDLGEVVVRVGLHHFENKYIVMGVRNFFVIDPASFSVQKMAGFSGILPQKCKPGHKLYYLG